MKRTEKRLCEELKRQKKRALKARREAYVPGRGGGKLAALEMDKDRETAKAWEELNARFERERAKKGGTTA